MHSWMVTVGGKAYGPYSPGQMQAFIAEGRIVPASLVGMPGASAPYPADMDPILGPLFAAPRPPPSRDESLPAESQRRDAAAPARFGRNSEVQAGEFSRFVILADIKSHSIHGLEEAIHNLGQAHLLLPQVWLLTSDENLQGVRNALVQRLGTLDMLFVIDTSHDKAAWYNFGPEADAKIRRVWRRPEQALRKSA